MNAIVNKSFFFGILSYFLVVGWLQVTFYQCYEQLRLFTFRHVYVYENINNLAERTRILGNGNILHKLVKHLGRLQMKARMNSVLFSFMLSM